MEMDLLDWTRMGRTYCLAGAVAEQGSYRVVRPLLYRGRAAPVRNFGWSAFLLDGHERWEVFELVGVQAAPPEPPHVEDCWVRALKPTRRLASPRERCAILAATMARPGEELFGAPLVGTHAAAHLPRQTGTRSLVTLCVPGAQARFHACYRDGMAAADFRVSLPVPGFGERQLPVKDHHLLRRAEHQGRGLEDQLHVLAQMVGRMGERLAVRLGLSRAFQGNPGRAPAACWLMADGFFSWSDPHP
jgi:hypothetical protein